jgi:tetratricopeptide (TPR) repeat protein
MTYLKSRPSFILRALLVTCVLTTSTVHADEYADVNQLVRSEKLTEAMVKVDSYLVANPRDPQMRFLKGVIQRNSGRHAEAINTFTKLTEDFPELPEPYNNLAVLYAGQNQFEKARTALEMAIRTNPSYATAHENLGGVFARLASQAYSSALQLERTNAETPPKLALIKEVFKPNLKVQPTAKLDVSNGAAATASPRLQPPVKAPLATPAPAPAAGALASATLVTAPKAVTTAPAPSTQPNPVAKDKSSNDVEVALQAWAKAWSSKDMNTYLGAYAKEFTPPGNQSRPVWEQERTKRILGKSNITVKLDNITVTVIANKAIAKFRQDYKANTLTTSSRKTLTLVKTGDKWLINKESIGN